MIEKACIVKGCKTEPSFGYGLPSWRLPMRWACGPHRMELNTAAKGASGAAADVALQVETPKLRLAGPQPVSAQGSLL